MRDAPAPGLVIIPGLGGIEAYWHINLTEACIVGQAA